MEAYRVLVTKLTTSSILAVTQNTFMIGELKHTTVVGEV
jgi:hypothetical protein